MGVTLASKNHRIDLGYFGFFRLRRQIAELLDPEVGKHYSDLHRVPRFFSKEEEKEYWEKYDKKTEDLMSMCPKNQQKVFLFLYEPDCDGAVTYGTCKQILDVIGDYQDNVIYGYAGQPDAARFEDFKTILQDCIECKCKLQWY